MIVDFLRLQPCLDHVQREDRAPGDNAGNAAAKENLYGGLVGTFTLTRPESLAKLIGPEAVMRQRVRSTSMIARSSHFILEPITNGISGTGDPSAKVQPSTAPTAIDVFRNLP